MTERIFCFTSPDEVEAAFYTAFVTGNLGAMQALWVNEGALCVHPGSHAIIGQDAVLRSWKHILTDSINPDIRLRVVQRTRQDNLAVHVIEEHISVKGSDQADALILATNIYREDDGCWYLQEHHASLIQSQHQGQTLQ